MNKEDFYFLLWGIGVALALQVFYDGLGDVLSGLFKIPKFYGGVAVIIAFFLCLVLIGRHYLGEKPKDKSA